MSRARKTSRLIEVLGQAFLLTIAVMVAMPLIVLCVVVGMIDGYCRSKQAAKDVWAKIKRTINRRSR